MCHFITFVNFGFQIEKIGTQKMTKIVNDVSSLGFNSRKCNVISMYTATATELVKLLHDQK